MPDSSTANDEALHGGATEDENLGGVSGQATQADDSADSAPADLSKDDNKPQTMADAVRAALSKGEEQSSGSGEGEGEKPGDSADPTKAKAKEGEEEELGELTDEELKSYKPKTQRRFKQLDEQNKALTAELEQAKPLGDRFLQIEKFTKDANLTREDVNTGFNIMKLMKNDPVAAYEALTPIYSVLRELVGVELPADLRDRVAKKEISPEAAQEMSRLRAKDGLTTNQRQVQQEQDKQRQAETQTRQVETVKTDVGKVISDWETRQKGSDPDYALKQGRIMERVELEILKGFQSGKSIINSAQDAVNLANRVKKEVDAEMKKFAPRRQAMTPVIGSGATNGSKPVAKSVHDAVAQAVGYN